MAARRIWIKQSNTGGWGLFRFPAGAGRSASPAPRRRAAPAEGRDHAQRVWLAVRQRHRCWLPVRSSGLLPGAALRFDYTSNCRRKPREFLRRAHRPSYQLAATVRARPIMGLRKLRNVPLRRQSFRRPASPCAKVSKMRDVTGPVVGHHPIGRWLRPRPFASMALHGSSQKSR